MPRALERLQGVDRLPDGPRLVGIDHHRAVLAHRLAQQVQPVNVALEVGMADLDLEAAIAGFRGVAEQLDESVVRQMEVQPARVDGNA